MTLDLTLAQRTEQMQASMLREILKVAARPGMISLAGGMPAAESFPLALIGQLQQRVLAKYGADGLQYSPTEGFPPLRAALAAYLTQKGILATAESIHITSGSQGALDALGKVLLDRGDRVAVEAPTYLGALQAFNPYRPCYVPLESDGSGLLPGSLERVLQQGRVKFVYLVPTFQNPTGRTIPLERRQQIAELLIRYRALLVEDDPYGELRYQGQAVVPIQTLAPDNVVYVGSLSKVLAPGFRIGYYLAPEPLAKWLVIAKQGVDLHTSTCNQALAAEYIGSGHLAAQLPIIVAHYRPKLIAMQEALARFFPLEYRWTSPAGGMFLWVEGPAGVDSDDLYLRAVARGVAFVPGRYFFTEPGAGQAAMRLNFTLGNEHSLVQAISILGQEIDRALPRRRTIPLALARR